MKDGMLEKFLGGALIGLVGFALDYFLLQHFVRTPINMAGGVTVVVVLLYLFVPFLILQFGGKKEK